MTAFEHDGYVGLVDTIDDEFGLMSGTVLGIADVIHFEGESVREAKASFVRAVEAYVAYCRAEDVEPQRPKSGRFNLRVRPQLHRRLEVAAAVAGQSLNEWIERHLERDVDAALGPADAA